MKMAFAVDPNTTVFLDFMRDHSVYEVMPVSSKVAVFDTELKVKKALEGMVSNGVRAGMLWDSREQRTVGLLTITDFINILHCYYRSPLVQMHELEEQQIQTWRNEALQRVYTNSTPQSLISISPNASLFEAVHLLLKFKIHRLPVINPETGTVLHILTHKRILKFLSIFLPTLPRPRILDESIMDLRIGTFSNLVVVQDSDSLYSALTKFVQRRVSALPVVNHKGCVVGLYSRFDVINLAVQQSYDDLDVTVSEALSQRTCFIEGVVKCYPYESLDTVIQRIVAEQVHRLVMVDDSDHVLGIVSLSDLLHALVLAPAGITLPP